MRRILLASVLTVLPLCALAHDSPPPAGRQRVTLVAGLGSLHHPVTTNSPLAQRFFDQGMRYLFAFNHAEAVRSFERAAELDPRLAMAHWGVALALGPNINAPMSAEQGAKALAALAKAQSLASDANGAERAYIAALAKRYSADPNAVRAELDAAYMEAMRELSKRYPNDVDAAVLYAESAMDLRPWKLWTPDGRPEPGTEEIVAVLESALARAPNHTGANHYYIHTVEASLTPERALPSAKRLERLAPAAGHLAHMPAHVYFRIGDYDGAARANRAGMRADTAYMRAGAKPGLYTMGYASHNMHFLAIGEAVAGRCASARRAAAQLVRHVEPAAKGNPDLDPFVPTAMLIDARCGRWSDVVAVAQPAFELPQTDMAWRFVRGMAFARWGKPGHAQAELDALRAALATVPKDAANGNNVARDVFRVADAQLAAAIARARGDRAAEIAELKKAIAANDALVYDEPPPWYLPPRETLGAALFLQGDFAGAEAVFRADLERNRMSGRSLWGLAQSLQAQGKTAEATAVRSTFRKAWHNADVRLAMDEL